MLQHDTGQNVLHPNQDDNTELFQTQEFQQFKTIPDPQQVTTMLQNIPYPSETATIQNVSELFDETINNPQSITITNDSNINQLPVHNIPQNPINDQTLNDAIQNTNQDNTSTLSISNTTIIQAFQTQQNSLRNYDPPPLSPQYSTQTTPHNSPQQGSSNTQTTNTVQFQTTTPTTQPNIPTLAYTPAQKTQTQNIQSALTINTLHSNAIPNYTTSRNLFRLPLQLFQLTHYRVASLVHTLIIRNGLLQTITS